MNGMRGISYEPLTGAELIGVGQLDRGDAPPQGQDPGLCYIAHSGHNDPNGVK